MPKTRLLPRKGNGTTLDTGRALQRILKQRDELLRVQPAREWRPDPIDAAQAIEDERVWLAVLERSDACRVRLGEALDRLTQGHYGECQDCGERIPSTRLQALPFAVRCISCQEEHERMLERGSSGASSKLRTGTHN